MFWKGTVTTDTLVSASFARGLVGRGKIIFAGISEISMISISSMVATIWGVTGKGEFEEAPDDDEVRNAGVGDEQELVGAGRSTLGRSTLGLVSMMGM